MILPVPGYLCPCFRAPICRTELHDAAPEFMRLSAILFTVAALCANGFAQTAEIILKNALALGTFNVRDYGARGDGATDDQQAIMAAENAAMAHRGGVVFFPQGRYLHGGILDFGSGVVVAGEAGSIVQGTNYANAAIRFIGAAGCGVFNIGIASDASARLANYESADIYLDGASNCAISGVRMDGSASAGIVIAKSNNIVASVNEI